MSTDTGDKPKEKPAKVDQWDASSTKNALDDAVKKYMKEKYECTEDHSLMNGRLLLSTIGVAFSLYAVVWDYLHPFPESRMVLITCVLGYFVVMGILTAYITFKEKSIFYVALKKDKAGIDRPNVWTFSSTQKKYDDMYELKIDYTDGSKRSRGEGTFTQSVTAFFSENGTLREDLFFIKLNNWCKSVVGNSNKKDK